MVSVGVDASMVSLPVMFPLGHITPKRVRARAESGCKGFNGDRVCFSTVSAERIAATPPAFAPALAHAIWLGARARANAQGMTQITLRRPDDWHLHLRDGEMLAGIAPESARHFGRAIIMPNLVPPVVTGDDAAAYRERILTALPEGSNFTPLMTLYLTETTDPADVAAAHASGLITALKLYPAGATTNSASGVRDFDKVRPVLELMAEKGIPLCVHGEVVDSDIDIFDREAVFIDRVLDPIRRATPGLRVVMEHITTKQGVDYARAGGDDLGATITTHHLVINRNHILVGGIKPHYYCLPVAKREEHRLALREAATSGDASFFLGTDSAPPRRSGKGKRLRLRRLLYSDQHAVDPRRGLRAGRGARQARGFRLAQWPVLLPPAGERGDGNPDQGRARHLSRQDRDRRRPGDRFRSRHAAALASRSLSLSRGGTTLPRVSQLREKPKERGAVPCALPEPALSR
ncbi:dihydroorotase [Alloyangia mangrovi]|uniref:dihydroorotase n=1 Tax=Alloyangia mangrovi TaxID=1779329 RepID=UPI0035D522E6